MTSELIDGSSRRLNASATASGVEAACLSMKKKGKLPKEGDVKILVIGGDGGTYDIGFQSLSGALERGHDFTYFCYDNNAYMNTGTQRSSATPRFTSATTTPAGIESVGKKQEQKDLTQIVVERIVVLTTEQLGNTSIVTTGPGA